MNATTLHVYTNAMVCMYVAIRQIKLKTGSVSRLRLFAAMYIYIYVNEDHFKHTFEHNLHANQGI